MGQTLTPDQLSDLIAELLAGVAGQSREHWRDAIGSVEKHPLWSHTRSNWTVRPRARKCDREAIAHAVKIVREAHPYVAG